MKEKKKHVSPFVASLTRRDPYFKICFYSFPHKTKVEIKKKKI
jgi:hypothetical protein